MQIQPAGPTSRSALRPLPASAPEEAAEPARATPEKPEPSWTSGDLSMYTRMLESRQAPPPGFESQELWPRLAFGSQEEAAAVALKALWKASGYRSPEDKLAPLKELALPVGSAVGRLLAEAFPATSGGPSAELRAHLEGRVRGSLERLEGQSLVRPSPDPEVEAHRQQTIALLGFVREPGLKDRLLDALMADPAASLYSDAGESSGLARQIYALGVPDPERTDAFLAELKGELAQGGLAELSPRGQRVFGVLVARADMRKLGPLLEDEFRRPHRKEDGPILFRLLVLNASACDSELEKDHDLDRAFPRLRHMVELLTESKLANPEAEWHHLENGWSFGLTERLEKKLWHGLYQRDKVPTVLDVSDGALSLNLKAARKHVKEMLADFERGPSDPKACAAAQMLEHLSRRDGQLLDRLLSKPELLLQDWNAVPVAGVRASVKQLRRALLDRHLAAPSAENRQEALGLAAALGREGEVLSAYYPSLASLEKPEDVLTAYREVSRHGPEETWNDRATWLGRLIQLVAAQGSENVLDDSLQGYRRLEDLLDQGLPLSRAMDIVVHELLNLNALLGGSRDDQSAPATIQVQDTHLTIGGSRIKRRT